MKELLWSGLEQHFAALYGGQWRITSGRDCGRDAVVVTVEHCTPNGQWRMVEDRVRFISPESLAGLLAASVDLVPRAVRIASEQGQAMSAHLRIWGAA